MGTLVYNLSGLVKFFVINNIIILLPIFIIFQCLARGKMVRITISTIFFFFLFCFPEKTNKKGHEHDGRRILPMWCNVVVVLEKGLKVPNTASSDHHDNTRHRHRRVGKE